MVVVTIQDVEVMVDHLPSEVGALPQVDMVLTVVNNTLEASVEMVQVVT